MKIAVVGCHGKMGKLICEDLKNIGHEVVEISRQDDINIAKNSGLFIDFSVASNSLPVSKFCAKNKIPLIIGTTGQTSDEIEKIKEWARFTPILFIPNTSSGIMFLSKALKHLNDLKIKDASIIEFHHKNKVDNPSGTALLIKSIIESNGVKVGDVKGIRHGDIVGSHTLLISTNDEQIEIKHTAFSRMAFVHGLEKLIPVIMSKSAGFYDVNNLFENIEKSNN